MCSNKIGSKYSISNILARCLYFLEAIRYFEDNIKKTDLLFILKFFFWTESDTQLSRMF